MALRWDPAKAASNIAKHGIDFADAGLALYDDLAITIQDDSEGEQRFVTLAADPAGRVLVVVYTWRDEVVRLISARPATPAERRRYEAKR